MTKVPNCRREQYDFFYNSLPNWPPGHLLSCLMAGCLLIFLEALLVSSSAALRCLPRAFYLLYVLFGLPSIHSASLLSVYVLSTHLVPSGSGWDLLPLAPSMTDDLVPFLIPDLHIFLCLLRDDNAIMLSSSKLTTPLVSVKNFILS
jgi:hypothetical protein